MGNRKDGVKVKNLDGMHGLMGHIMPNRCDSDVYINSTIDVTNLVEYITKLKTEDGNNHITYFHAFCAASSILLYNRPLLNRFVINKNHYDRNKVTISFVAKQEFTDDSKENFTVLNVEKNDTIFTISDKVSKHVKNVRTNKTNNADELINKIGKMPKLIRAIAVGILKFADNHDLLPSSLTNNSIYHGSLLVSNLGSINCGAIYHHLIDFGTNSILMTIGKIKDAPIVIDGKVEIRKVCDFGVNIDERIADGFYFVKSLELFEYILKNPELLENEVSTKIILEKK